MNNLDNKHSKTLPDFCLLCYKLLYHSNISQHIKDFLKEISDSIGSFSKCDAVSIRLIENGKCYIYQTTIKPKEEPYLEIIDCVKNEKGEIVCCREDSDFEKFHSEIITGKRFSSRVLENEDYKTIVLIPIFDGKTNVGVLELKNIEKNFFNQSEIEHYEKMARIIGVSFTHWNIQIALRERIKELTCMYAISQIAEEINRTTDEVLNGIAKVIPPAFLYPEICSCRIIFDEKKYLSPNLKEGVARLSSDIFVKGEKRGFIEVLYSEKKSHIYEGPFLKEERTLIDAVARQISIIIERREAEDEKTIMEEKIRHSDRLATIGQITASVAHELNEPLANILGFAQLSKRYSGIPKQVEQDIEKIVFASLHSREIIRKLLVFSRQMPIMKTKVNINKIVEDVLYFFKSRCEKEGIELKVELSSSLPETFVDQMQIHQVLVNLIVNALQAMTQGDKLKIKTEPRENFVLLIVEDTGIGMSSEVKKKIFMPFFTTKGTGQGTGLGLSVVHGIITAHGGDIKFESEEGRGTRFEIRLPIDNKDYNGEDK